MSKLRIAGIVNDSIVDGPGMRLAVFTQGCHRYCPGCHNPHTWDPNGGQDISIEEILQRVDQNPLLSGVTLTGGEPFEQPEPLIELVKELKKRCLEVAIPLKPRMPPKLHTSSSGILVQRQTSSVSLKNVDAQ